jgi:hypothetical protein
LKPKFLISEKVIEECTEKLGVAPPKFKDVTSIDHAKYLEEIKAKDALLVCTAAPTPEFPDNIQGECSECHCDIYYRPYNQNVTKKVCESCGLRIIEIEQRARRNKDKKCPTIVQGRK